MLGACLLALMKTLVVVVQDAQQILRIERLTRTQSIEYFPNDLFHAYAK